MWQWGTYNAQCKLKEHKDIDQNKMSDVRTQWFDQNTCVHRATEFIIAQDNFNEITLVNLLFNFQVICYA